jgi:hypothetical protein
MRLFIAGLVVLSFFSIGCGKGNGKARATGTVTVDGKSLQSGLIVMSPIGTDGSRSDSGDIVAGRFDFEVRPGKKKVAIYPIVNHGPAPKENQPNVPIPKQLEYVLEGSDEKEITAAGKNEFELNLKSQSK